MHIITVVQFTAEEREPFQRVSTSLTIAYPGERIREPEPRAVFALATKGQDVTHELLLKATGLALFVGIVVIVLVIVTRGRGHQAKPGLCGEDDEVS